MQGLHLTADLYQCRCESAWLTDASQLSDWCGKAVEAVGLHAVNQVFQALPAGGVTATVLLAESHVCLHTWPGERSVTIDVYVCNFGDDNSAKARGLMYALVNRFQPDVLHLAGVDPHWLEANQPASSHPTGTPPLRTSNGNSRAPCALPRRAYPD